MAFNGYLISIGGAGLPYKYISAESYKCHPDQRMESSAKRVSTGVLHRVTCEHTATKIEWETPALWDSDMRALTGIFDAAFTNAQERKLNVTYYDTWTNQHKTGTFYMPDPEQTILRVDAVNHRILYAPMRIALIEY
jgi:hypothetical protein